MDFRSVCTACSLISLPFGLAFVAAPASSAAMYGVSAQDAATLLVGRYFGSEVLMYAAATWALRALDKAAAQRAAATALGLATLVGLSVSLHGVAAGTLNALGWSSVALYGLFVLAWMRIAFTGAHATGHA